MKKSIHNPPSPLYPLSPISYLLRFSPSAHRWINVVVLAAVAISTHACSYYSFTGATIPQHLDSIAIPLVEDASTSPLSDLNSTMTQLLVDRFVGQTRLSLEPTESDADALLSVQIQRYVNQPAAVGGQERANLNRITITVMATYMDRVENRQLFERAFSASDEYDPLGGFEEEEAAAANILANIADDIFTAATSNW